MKKIISIAFLILLLNNSVILAKEENISSLLTKYGHYLSNFERSLVIGKQAEYREGNPDSVGNFGSIL